MPTLYAAARALAAFLTLTAALPIATGGALAQPGPVAGAASNTPTARVIVKYKASAGAEAGERGVHVQSAADGRATVQRLNARLGGMARRHGIALRAHRAISERSQVVLAQGIDSAALAQRLSADPEVEYAVPDRWVRRAALPNDERYLTGGSSGPAVGQWYLKAPTALLPSAIDAATAWDVTRGSANVVVAVLDTGVRFEHPDLGRAADGGKLLPGYDFVTNVNDANDGGGRDADASDPGDWVTTEEVNAVGGPYYHCVGPDPATGQYLGEDSSWHGTHVAALVGALSNNGIGMAGTSWNARVLPVRVLGKCGGFESDVAIGMRWAAGLNVPGVPLNPTPAKVLNLSLGSDGACGSVYQGAVDAVLATGAVVVAAAGNTNGHAARAPASCNGVIGVGGLRHTGTKVAFSDLGPGVAISAPAGNCGSLSGPCLYPLLTATNTGGQGPGASAYTDSFDISVGTSFSAPLVAGAAALVLSVHPNATPAQVRSLLQSSARPFPTSGADPGTPQCLAPQAGVDQGECYCTTTTCGAGMLDARAAVQAARTQALAATGVQALIAVTPANPVGGQTITLDASGSLFSGSNTLASTTWTLLDGGGIATGDPAPGTQTTITPTGSGGGTLRVQVRVTDSVGQVSTQALSIYVAGQPVADSGGGGGGALGFGYLLALLAAVGAAWRLRQCSGPAV